MEMQGLSKVDSHQRGFTLIELLVALAITVVVMSGVVQVLTVSKSNFITGRELAISQENARYAMQFITEEIRMAGFTGCTSTQAKNVVNVINGASGSWYLGGPGISGYDYDAGINSFPAEFRSDVLANTDALVVRRAVSTGVHVVTHSATASQPIFSLNKTLGNVRGQAMLITSPDCSRIAIFQVTAPNAANQTMVHNTGNPVSPGNCEKGLASPNAQSWNCGSAGTPAKPNYEEGSPIHELRSEAFYIGSSNGVPTLYRERMLLDPAITKPTLTTTAEELVKGVENMQIFYGLDTDSIPLPRDGLADTYVKANAVTSADVIVSIRISLRMRSQLPVYTQPVDFAEFEGVAGTDGSDRFMRQDISTTITVRNF